MPQLNPEWFASQVFWLLATFTLLYLLLARIVLPPLLRILDERGSRVSGDLEAAQRFKEEAEAARQQYEASLADARLRSQQVFADASLAMKQQADKAGAEMDRRIAERLAQAQEAIAMKKQELYTALKEESAALAAGIVEKFTHSRPDAAQVKAALQSASQTDGR